MRTQQTTQSSGDSASPSGNAEHIPVLLQEATEAVKPGPGKIVFDGTVGAAGHALALAQALGPTGTLVIGDLDPVALQKAQEKLRSFPGRLLVHEGSFADVDTTLSQYGITAVDGILLDLGWSMEQFAGSGRGFSFQKDEPLNMRFDGKDETEAITAKEVLQHWSEETLADIFYHLGGERFARRIARAIVAHRTEKGPIVTTGELAALVASVIPKRFHTPKRHPATKVFQALRIAVNDEFGALTRGIPRLINLLAPEGRLAIITFHSAEDRLVKRLLRLAVEEGQVSWVSKKPIVASSEEIARNPRARSAQLRVVEKLSVSSSQK